MIRPSALKKLRRSIVEALEKTLRIDTTISDTAPEEAPSSNAEPEAVE